MAHKDLPLSLTENLGSPESGDIEIASEADIRRLVVSFYATAREDPMLGPIFVAEVADWDKHFDRMCDFWSSAVLKTGRYSGRPALKHFGLGLTPEHFSHWLAMWTKVSTDELGETKAAPFIDMGQRMGRAMMNVTGLVG